MKVTTDQIKSALDECFGIPGAAASRLGIARSTLAERIKRNPDLQRAVKSARERANDFAESALFRAIKKENVRAITFYLSTRHPAYRPTIEINQQSAPPRPLDEVKRELAALGFTPPPGAVTLSQCAAEAGKNGG